MTPGGTTRALRAPPGRSGRRSSLRRSWRPLLLVACLSAATAADATAQACAALDVGAMARVAPTPEAVRAVQAVLYTAYPGASETQEGRAAFVDGVLGFRTLQLAQRFCRDLGLASLPDAAPLLRQGMAAFEEVVRSRPGWRAQVADPGFVAWASALPASAYPDYYRLGPDGPRVPTSALLLDDWPDAPAEVVRMAVQLQYRVTDESVARLNALGASSLLVSAVGALRELPVPTREEAESQVDDVIASLEARYPSLFASVPADSVRAVIDVEGVPAAEPGIPGGPVPEISVAEAPAPVAPAPGAAPQSAVRYRVTAESVTRLQAMGAPSLVRRAVGALRDLPTPTQAEAEAQVATALASLEERFPSLFATLPVDQVRGAIDIEEFRTSGPTPEAPAFDQWLAAEAGDEPEGIFVLTDSALELLQLPPEPVRYRVAERAVAELTVMGAPPQLVERIRALRELPRATPDSVAQDVAAAIAAVEEIRPSAFTTWTPARFRAAVTTEEVRPRAALQGPGPSEAVLAGLARLKDIRFPDAHLFREALRIEAGVGASRAALRARILAAAARPPWADTLQVKPIQWDGVCGCGTFVKDSDEYPLYLYGMYPFWAAPQQADSTDRGAAPEQVIDFSMLTRVGYYGLTFDARGALGDRLHWQKGDFPADAFLPWRRSAFDDFVAVAHRHKTDVDVVVANADWDDWLPAAGAAARDTSAVRSRNQQALERLTGELAGLISQPLDGVLDRLKPVISLGQSPRKTLGDGITLDLDVTGLDGQDQTWLLATLRDQLLRPLRDTLDTFGASGLLIDLGIEYSINLIVPGYCLSEAWPEAARADCVFYSPESLAALEPFIDLMLVDFSREPPAPGSWAVRPTDLSLAQGLQNSLDGLTVDDQVRLRAKLLPLVIAGEGAGSLDGLAPAFRYAGWNFNGAGVWSVPVDPVVNDSLARAMMREPIPVDGPRLWRMVRGPVVALGLEARVCTVVCPRRWLLRTGVVLGLLLLLGVWIASSWWFELKGIYETNAAPIFTLVIGLALVATLWCDPYWSERRSGILLVSLGGLLLYSLFAWQRKRREREYP